MGFTDCAFQQHGKTRMCIDYQHINALTAWQHWPLPNIEDCVNALQRANQKLEEQLCHALIRAFPNFDEPFILTTDVSLVGIGGVLTQNAA